MTSRSAIPLPAHQTGERLHGFVVDSVTELPDIKARAYEATHERTGAKLLHVHCDDEENMFSVGFRTPPPDSTGVAHILEHCVLAGSRKYPVQDAFNELRKRTLHTFLNAMTWPDRTIYPTCSAVRADFFNLAAVYADLVFNPLITEQTFQQEGHHLEFERIDDTGTPLKVTGVVYNEMKGAYSSPENIVQRYLQQALLPDGPYGEDSGGDPEAIPDLTYEDFVAFHRRFYSPSNARFFLYGDIETADNLAFLAGVLEPFERVDVDSELPVHDRWTEPRTCEVEYPVGAEDSLDDKTFVTLAWMANETADVEESLKLSILSKALTGSAAGPVRKALIDSGLGQDVYPSASYHADLRHGTFTIGLRGSNPEKADAVEALVLDELKKLAADGLPKDLIEASLHQVEFQGREIKPPFPIMLLIRANRPWYFGGDPKAGLQFSEAIANIRRDYQADPELFDTLVRRWLVDNPHRLRLVVRPSNDLARRQDARFEERMAKLKESLSDADRERIRRQAVTLKERQEGRESPEALASLPSLALEDIPREVRSIPTDMRMAADVAVFEHDVFSNGVGYVGLSFDVGDLADADAPYLPLFGKATLEMGAGGLDYEQMATRIAGETGGLEAGQFAGKALTTGNPFQQVTIDGKVLGRNAGALAAILEDLLTAADTSDHKRLEDLVRASFSRMQSRIVPHGHFFAYVRGAAPLGQHLYRREQWEGATQLRFLKDLVGTVDDQVAQVAEKIAGLQKQIFTRARLSVNLAGDPEVLDALRPAIDGLLQALPPGDPVVAGTCGLPAMPWDSGVVIPTQVNYVSQVLPVPDFLDPAAPALELLSGIISSDFLYRKLRVQGGAYGGFSLYAKEAGILPMISYRDPHLLETFEVYGQLADWLQDSLGDEAVEGSRIGTIGTFDRVLSPAQSLEAARRRRFHGISDAHRKAFLDGLFSATADQIRDVALPHVERTLAAAPRAVLGSKERLEEANAKLDRKLELFWLE